MRFSTRTEYGIRTIVRLGQRYGRGPVSLADLAEQEGLPPSYLEQIAGQLRRSGLIISRMGARGGYVLTRPPQSISIAEIIRLLEGSLAPVSCLAEGGGPGECTHAETPCSAHGLWERLHQAITETLEGVTVADLMRKDTAGQAGGPATPRPEALPA